MPRTPYGAYKDSKPQSFQCVEGCIDPLPAMPTTNNPTYMTAAATFSRPAPPATRFSTSLTRRRHFGLPAAAVLLAAVAPAVQAEAGNPLNDRFSVSLGGFLLNTETEIRVDGTTPGSGTEIDGSTDLGLQDSDRFRIDAYWRMTPRQKLRLMYFDTSANGTRVIDRDINFGDTVYPIDAEVNARVKTQVLSLQYEFDFLQGDNFELGGTFGIHTLKFETGLSVDSNGQTAGISSSAEVDGPLPVIGLHGVWRFNDKFYMDAGLQYFQISLDPYDGSVTDFNISGVWQFSDHWGVGAGWNQFRTSLEVDGDRFDGELTWKYSGARIFVTASF